MADTAAGEVSPGSSGSSNGNDAAAPAAGGSSLGSDDATATAAATARARSNTAMPSAAPARPAGFLGSRPKATSLGGQHSSSNSPLPGAGAGDGGAAGTGAPTLYRHNSSSNSENAGSSSGNYAGGEMKRSLRAFGDKLMYNIEAGSKKLAAKMKEDREKARVRGLWEQRKERMRALRWKEDKRGARVDKAKCARCYGFAPHIMVYCFGRCGSRCACCALRLARGRAFLAAPRAISTAHFRTA